MTRITRFAGVAAVSAVAFLACPTPQPGSAYFLMTITPPTINGVDGTATLKVEALNDEQKPGTGTVSLVAGAGSLGGMGKATSVTLDAMGRGASSSSAPGRPIPTARAR